MDVVSHGLWSAISFGRKNKKYFLLAVLFGMLPDVLAFGWVFVKGFFNASAFAKPAIDAIPTYIHVIYSVTHSLVIAGVVCALVLYVLKEKALPILGWPLHVLFDIPVHGTNFFPTPYLWPFATPFVDGIPWSTPWVFYMNWGVLLFLMCAWLIVREKKI